MATISDVATAVSLIGKVIKAATDAQMLKKEFKELADYLELVGRQLEMLDDRELDDASMQTFQKMEEVLLQCNDLANSCQQRSSIYLIVKGKRIQNELRGAQEKITKYLTLIPLIHFTQVFRRFKEKDTKIIENCHEHASDESDIPSDESDIPGLLSSLSLSRSDIDFTQVFRQCKEKDTKIIENCHEHASDESDIPSDESEIPGLVAERTGEFTDNRFQSNAHLFTYGQIVEMTFNFETIIGRGGFGRVYYGLLEDGTDVAIKLRTQSTPQGDKEFLAELRSLTRVCHNNLISLMGYCKDGSNLAIVYEYMPQGSLQDHLRGEAGVLTWAQRLQIAYQAALGLEYLHTGCNPPIVHRDVKSSNILLDSNLEAKITDFGISKVWNENDTDETTVVVGTPGYLDPEYAVTYHYSDASDVYSFGIILLEMITGQRPIIRGPEVQQHIVQWISLRVSSGVDFVDSSMNETYDTSSVWKVLQLALSCTNSSASRRPRMAEVVIQLEEIIEMKRFKYMTEDMNNEDMENEEVEEAFITSSAQADRPVCMHQLSANLFTSWTHTTPGRRFWRCKNWKIADDCGYFEWHDPVQENVTIEQMDLVIHQRDELDEEIKMMDEQSAFLFCALKALKEKLAECKSSKKALEMKLERMDKFYERM